MKRPVRIGGASGATSDRRLEFSQLVSAHPDDPVDVLMGDFMSEANMTSLAARKAEHGWDPHKASSALQRGTSAASRSSRKAGVGWIWASPLPKSSGAEGEVVIAKQKGRGGIVSVETCTAQLLYGIQGPRYFNSDVTAIVDNIRFTQIGENRVSMYGVESTPPPATTKVGITAHGGFQAEMHYLLVGVDIPAEARMFEQQVRHCLRADIPKFTLLDFQLLGTTTADPQTQASATATLRIVLQAKSAADLALNKFLRPIVDLVMSSYLGGYAKAVEHRVHMPDMERQPSAPSYKVGPVREFGETVRAPLGLVGHGRSGDKGSDSSVGGYRMKTLLAKEYNGKEVDRFELPHIHAVHFLLHDHLDRA
ncbi:hypothetical protein C8F04DRAFT_1276528 [Mycena alexandri]|uniref:Acyclic terpene utilisation N-terminal domain-containing protein n=1 Tax=Mycena alexandri TaxID=1745969 RepID=A0AAD6WNF3_9AGAR|nr:hypothetical protein C8F04DRAFT_1276528 [Mycena alexandri]